MGIRNIFKKRDEASQPVTEKETKKETKATEATIPDLKGNDFSYRNIISPYLTEKTTILNADGQYAFKVFPKANKIEIKKAIERLYSVHVEKIRIMVVPSKARRLGKYEGEKTGFKKAIVRLRKGEKIEVAH
ncbi:MAG: 50S ribosomal protein L23 [bacterium]|nr:50S ribosomal protein L23 [bacterium]